MLRVGTSGFAYDDWRGLWYPPLLPRRAYFDYYAERFDAIEINATFYQIYSPAMMRSLVRRAAGRVRFAVKMTEIVTHHLRLERRTAQDFVAGIAPALEAGVLDAVLLQFPQRFHCTPPNRAYLLAVLRTFRIFPLVVEIRHFSWQTPKALEFLRDHNVSLCLTDNPGLRGLPRRIDYPHGLIGYIRFHGRNAYQWWRGEYPGARYDYHYSAPELADWVEQTQTMARTAASAWVFFNNHVRAQAPRNAETFMAMLGQAPRAPAYQDLFNPGTMAH